MSDEKDLKAPKEKSKGAKALSNLGNLNTINLGGVVGEKATVNAKKDNLLIKMDLIEEDPLNVRLVFNELQLEQLAESIKENGVLTPISVRDNPKKPGHFIINNGARRFRASKIAEQEFIPAFVDNSHDELNQMIDNIQREDLTILEIAEKIQQLLNKGDVTKSVLAKRAGKPAAWISKHLSALSMPPLLKFLYDSGQCKDLEAINMIVSRWEKYGVELHKWLESFQGTGKLVTQAGARKIIKSLEEKEEKLAEEKAKSNQIDIEEQINDQVVVNPIPSSSEAQAETSSISQQNADDGVLIEDKGVSGSIAPQCFDEDLSVNKTQRQDKPSDGPSVELDAVDLNISAEDSTIEKAAKVLTVLKDVDLLTPIFKDENRYVSLKISLLKGTTEESKIHQSKAVSKLLSHLEELRKEFPDLDLDIGF